MSRHLIVAVDRLTSRQRDSIRSAAANHGFDARFFDRDTDALPAAWDAEIIFSHSVLLARNAPRLRWQCTPFAGVEPFTAPDAFASRDAALTHSSGAYGVTMAEHIVMVTLELMRRQAEYARIIARREWKRDLPVRSIRGSRITLLGTGDVGREAAARLRAFSPDCIVGVNRLGRNPGGLFDRVLTRDRLDGILPETDLLILALPATKETRHILDAKRLALLPDGAILVNVGRGSTVEQAALVKELRAERLYAALDVLEQEPPAGDDPIWNCPHLLMTPHVSGNLTLPYTAERVVQLFLEDFENYCAGRPLLRLVDRTQGY